MIEVVTGAPTDEEIAALVGAVLALGAGRPAEPAPAPRSAWWASGLPDRPRDWRTSGLPGASGR